MTDTDVNALRDRLIDVEAERDVYHDALIEIAYLEDSPPASARIAARALGIELPPHLERPWKAETVGLVHVLAAPGDKRALCGSTEYPRVWKEAMAAHMKGWGMKVCPSCEERGQ